MICSAAFKYLLAIDIYAYFIPLLSTYISVCKQRSTPMKSFFYILSFLLTFCKYRRFVRKANKNELIGVIFNIF